MNKISMIILISALVVSLLFAGLGRSTEISDYAVVSGVAIDRTLDKWRITALITVPSKDDPYGSKSESVKGEGLTLKEAFDDAEQKTDKEFYTDSVRIFVVSDSLKDEKEITDYFLSADVNMRSVTVYCEGRAESLFQSDSDRSIILADKIKRYCFEIRQPVPKIINFLKQDSGVYLTEDGFPERSDPV